MNPGAWSFPLGLFDAFGVELEYMIVDRDSLEVRPICDRLFERATGRETSDVEPDGEGGVVSWSNELALHVVEFKTQRPAATLDGLAEAFQDHVRRVNDLLGPLDARLLPTGMHPWMHPDRETRLWPHENTEIYRTYDRIFGCRGHGWGNLQSTHINLPFADDDEFGRLYAAVRLLLPIIPALTASTPIVDGACSPLADHRMEVYRTNSVRVPMMAGLVIPEPTFTRDAFEREVLGRLYADLAPLDPEGVLRHEFANARGGMARFDRGAIEIRVIDIQECPLADVAVTALIVEVLRQIVAERWMPLADQQRADTAPLHAVLLQTIRDAERARLRERAVLDAFGVRAPSVWAADLWASLLEQALPGHPVFTPILRRMIDAGTLASRIRGALRGVPTRADLQTVYAELADCLQNGALFRVP